MDANLWRRVEALYYRIAAAPAETRPDLLDEACQDDPDLRREVERLLQARDRAGDFLSPDGLVRQIADLTPESSVPRIGAKVGSYEVLAVLGAGAMGEVFRAHDTRLGRDVALKLLPAHVMHDQSRIARFQSEARAASSLNHPNAVTIYEIGSDGDVWFIAAELIDGVTLRSRLNDGRLAAAEAISVALQCASSLEAAHRAGIIHRDVKPENIMLRPDGVVKVVDFGLARILEPGGDSMPQMTQTGSVIGTPRYMSPEQARGGKLDARSDVFSLGAVLFEMIYGRPAFPGSTTADVFAALLCSDPAATGDSALDEVIGKALEKDPAARYATMDAFADALRSVEAGHAHPARNFRKQVSRAHASGIVPALLLLVFAGVAIYAWTNRRDLAREQAPKLVPLTAAGGDKREVALSPDGAQIAFSWVPPGKDTFHIYTMRVGESDPVQLTFSPSHDALPAWSPDGKWIAFCREGNPNDVPVSQGIYIVPASGGSERKIADGWHGVSWSPDGKTLALSHLPSGPASSSARESGGIFLLAIDSGERREITSAQRDRYPLFSPDGKWIGFVRDMSAMAAEIFVVRTAGGGATQLTFDRQEMRGMTWTADSRELVFASSRSGADGSLWRVSVNGGAPQPVSSTLRGASGPSISPRAHRLAYKENWIDTNIYLLTNHGFSVDKPARFGPPAPVVNWTLEEHSPAFSPDGERLAFVSNRSGNQEIWVSRRDGSQAVALTSLRAQNTGSPRWSPDGRWIAFDSWSSGNSAIYVVPSQGGVPRVLSADPSGSWMPSWSPDGEWIYFSRGLYVTRQIWRVPAAGGAATQLTHSGAFESAPSPDGKWIYFTKQVRGPECTVWSVPAAGGPEKIVPELARFSRISRGWGVNEQGIYFMSYEDSPQQTVRLFDFKTRKITPLFTLDKQVQWGVPSLAVSRDGHYVLAVQLDHSVNDFMMIENFR